jgi:DNA-binding transcriptional LysR family regulator
MIERALDLDAVQAFIHIAELGSFTRAAEAMRTTQAGVSLKLKRLEKRLGCRLVERTPGYVQLSARGAAFLEHARELFEIHDRALAVLPQPDSASPSASATMLRGRNSRR